MTKLSYILVLILGMLTLGACNDEFLERYPIDEISSETFWNTENDLLTYNNNFYHMSQNDVDIPIMLGHNNSAFDGLIASYLNVDGFSDNLAPNHGRHQFFQQVRAGKQVVHTESRGKDNQWYGYRGWNFVRSINIGLENYPKADIPEEIRNKYVAEARLFRGWFYHHIVKMFGDAPWVDKELKIGSEELYAPRVPREEVMDNVLADLNFAIEWIPEDWEDGNNPGRLNRWAALLIKSRICLFEGTWRKYHGGSNPEMWLNEAADAAKEVMESGQYSLYDTGNPEQDYNAFHRILDLSGNPEVMVWRRYQLGILTNHIQNYYSYTGGATRSFVEDYLCKDGLPITLSDQYKGDNTIEDVFVNRDPRLRQTILHPEDSDIYKYHVADGLKYPRIQGQPGGRTSSTGYHVIKHYNADDMIGKAYATGETPAIILRYAEALLNYAEAKAELGTISQGDLDMSINLLRNRVDMPHLTMAPPMDPRYANDGISPLLVEIRRERRIELFGEGFRYDDLRRWKQGKKLEKPDMGIQWNDAAMERYKGAIIQTSIDPENGKTYIDVYKGTDYGIPVFNENRDYLWPIPLSDLAQNPKLAQNPGWE